MGASRKSVNPKDQPGAAAQSIPQPSMVTRSRRTAFTPLLQLASDGENASGLVDTSKKSSYRVRQSRQARNPVSLPAAKTVSRSGRPDPGPSEMTNTRSTRSRKRGREDDDDDDGPLNESVSKKQRRQPTPSRGTKPSQRAQSSTAQQDLVPARKRKRTEGDRVEPVSKRLRRNAIAPNQASNQHVRAYALPLEPHPRSQRKRVGPDMDRSDVKRRRGEPASERTTHDETPLFRRRSSRIAQKRLRPSSRRVGPSRKSPETIGTGPVVLIPIGRTAQNSEEALEPPEQLGAVQSTQLDDEPDFLQASSISDEARYLYKISTAPDIRGHPRQGTSDHTRRPAASVIVPPRLIDWVAEPFPIVYKLTGHEWKGKSSNQEDRSVSVDSGAHSFAGESTMVKLDSSDIKSHSESAMQLFRTFTQVITPDFMNGRASKAVNVILQYEPEVLDKGSVRAILATCMMLLRPQPSLPEEVTRETIRKLGVPRSTMRAVLPQVASAIDYAGVFHLPARKKRALDWALKEDQPFFEDQLARINAMYDGTLASGSHENSLFGDDETNFEA